MHILGQMFVSTNYICFTSKEETLCSLIIPLREVSPSPWDSSCISILQNETLGSIFLPIVNYVNVSVVL